MNTEKATTTLAHHNVLLSGLHGRTLESFIDGSSTHTLISLLPAAQTLSKRSRNAQRLATEIVADLRFRQRRGDPEAARFLSGLH